MLDQDTAHALLTVTAEAGATVALVGDRAQLPAVGRGGVLDMAAQIRGRTYDMTELHRFTDPDYAALTLAMRDRRPRRRVRPTRRNGPGHPARPTTRPASTSPRTPATARRSPSPPTTKRQR